MSGRFLRRLTVFVVTAVVALVVASPAWASTITVNSTADARPTVATVNARSGRL